VQAGRRLLQGAQYRYALTAYCGGSPLQDRIDMVLTDASGNIIWQLQGKRECAKQQSIHSLQNFTILLWKRIGQIDQCCRQELVLSIHVVSVHGMAPAVSHWLPATPLLRLPTNSMQSKKHPESLLCDISCGLCMCREWHGGRAWPDDQPQPQ
jgi:hypothetical protein